jgi:hypothetical protein
VPILKTSDIEPLYDQFESPITAFDCGKKCAPHNEYGVPFCCDTRHAIPTAYQPEWDYLWKNTNLWHLWDGVDPVETNRLRAETPEDQVLIECLGHLRCQRNFRSITCRAFPFFPYISKESVFVGMSYYWQYEDRCWVISHLERVTGDFCEEFFKMYDDIFKRIPQEFDNFHYHSKIMRQVFGRRGRAIPLLHRNGGKYKITPRNGRMRRVDSSKMPQHGPYKIANLMPFPDELES